VHLDHGVPLGLGHVDQHAIAEDAGVVDEHVDLAEGLDPGRNQLLGPRPVADVVGIGHGVPARGGDLVDHLLRRAGVAARAVHGATEVVDHDAGPLGGQQEGVLAADAAACAGHDGHSSVTDAHGRGLPSLGQVSALPRDRRVRVAEPVGGIRRSGT
jgi:hypothetical protein